MAKGEKPILSVRIDQCFIDGLERMVERSGASRAELVERFIGRGLETDEKVMDLLESRMTGPVMGVLTHPKVIGAILKLLGAEIDPPVLKMRESARSRRARKAGRSTAPRMAT